MNNRHNKKNILNLKKDIIFKTQSKIIVILVVVGVKLIKEKQIGRFFFQGLKKDENGFKRM